MALADSPQKTILIVDDLAIFREPIEVVLTARGYRVNTASNGQDAMASLSCDRPDLILLDLGMPIMDGISVLRLIRGSAAFKSIPVVVLSAESERERVKEAVSLGISGYMLKSQFSLKDMQVRVAQILKPRGTAKDSGSRQAESQDVPAILSAAPLAANPDPTTPSVNVPEHSANQGASGALLPNDGVSDIKDLKPEVTRSELMDRLKKCEELKGFSPTVARVLKLTANPNCSLEAVAKAVTQDQAMALKILKVANSSVYSRGDRVDTVQKAVLRIGMESIRQAVMNIGVVEHFSSESFQKHLGTALFWEHSIACGIIAAEIAHAQEAKDADSAFTSGLLHDLGRVILAEALGNQYVRVIETARRLEAPLEQIETRMLLMNHADVMDRLLTTWHFPRHLVDPIMFHHLSAGNARSVSPTKTQEILRLGLADRLAHAMLLGSSGNDTIYPTEEHCRALNIRADTIRTIEDSARQQTADTKVALLAQAHGNAWPQHSAQVRACLTNPFRPLYVSMEPELDAFRIFCAELSGLRDEEPANVAVVHVTTAKERDGVAQRLMAAEADSGVAGLPVLVLSPAGQFTLPERTLHGRMCRVIGTPMPVARFVNAINALTAPAARAAAA